MLFQGKDGELRIIEQGLGATTYYIEVLFCEMDFNGAIARPRTEESLMMNRGLMDTDSHYVEGGDGPRYEPIPITFSCRLNDTVNSQVLSEWISGVTNISGATQIYSTKGRSTIDGNTLPAFSDSTSKYTYTVEVKWDGTTDYGQRYEEVYFTPGEQSITESADNLMLSCSGMVYGDVTRITSFTGTPTAIV